MGFDTKVWLEGLGLGRYAPAFAEHEIGPDLLRELDHESLLAIGVGIVGHRLTILQAARRLDPANPESATAAPASPAGAPVVAAPAAEHRLLAVLFADLVGSTAMSERFDSEVLRDLLHEVQVACDRTVRRYGGHVAQVLGDGVMAYFGWPNAHEDDTSRAVHAALDIVEAVGALEVAEGDRLRVRVGVATGPVVVGDMEGTESSLSRLAVGQTPNLAARLQELAKPGQVLIDAQSRRLVGGAFEGESIGERSLKGIAEPVLVWRVDRVASGIGRFAAAHVRGVLPLIGREAELSALVRGWRAARAGEGRVAMLRGDPGIGKSRLLAACARTVRDEGGQATGLQCSPFYTSSALWPVVQGLERELGLAGRAVARFAGAQDPGAPVDTRLDAVEAFMVGRNGLPREDARYVATLLSLPADRRYGASGLSPQRFKEETLRTLTDLAAAASRRQPGVLWIEDLHWADPTTLEWLDSLVWRVRDLPLFVVLTCRPEFGNRWAGSDVVDAVDLPTLDREQCAQLARHAAAGEPLSDGWLDEIVSRTDGVPLFVEELTRAVVESAAGALSAAAPGGLDGRDRQWVPTTLRGSLTARLDRLARAKPFAQIGAAIGREFDHALISAVAAQEGGGLDDALGQLAGAGLILRRGDPPDASYVFKHALVQDAAYESMLTGRRRTLHARIARAITVQRPDAAETDPGLLAQHLTLAGETAEAMPHWIAAADRAVARSALAEAASILDRALDIVRGQADSESRIRHELELLIRRNAVVLALEGWAAEGLRVISDRAAEVARGGAFNDLLVRLLLGGHTYVINRGRVEESAARANELIRLARGSEVPITGLVSQFGALHSDYFAGSFSAVLDRYEQVKAGYAGTPRQTLGLASGFWLDDAENVRVLSGIYACRSLWILGHPDRAVACLEEVVAIARTFTIRLNLGLALTLGAEIFGLRGEPNELARRADECREIAVRDSIHALTPMLVPIAQGVALIGQGAARDGIERLSGALAVWEGTGGKLHLPRYRTLIAQGRMALGEPDEAKRLIDEVIDQVERPGWGEREFLAEALRVRGCLLERSGDTDGAAQAYRSSLEVARRQGARSWELRTAVSLASLLAEQGRSREGLELLAPVFRWFSEGFDTLDLQNAADLLQRLEKASG